MVELSIFVRPKTGYANARKIRKITVDSSIRLEKIISDLKLPKKGSLLYANGRELPLNSSLASHNIQNGDVLESCSSPLLSAALSAVLQDLNAVDRIPEDLRSEERIRPLLDDGIEMDPWPASWSRESIKTRIICLAMMKKVLQRDDRYADLQVPPCQDLMELRTFMLPIWNRNNNNNNGRQSFNSMVHIFKPTSKNRGGKPTTCWELMQHKLNKLLGLAASGGSNDNNLLEEFVRMENESHKTTTTEPSNGTSQSGGTPRRSSSQASSTPPARRRRVLPSPSSTTAVSTCSTSSCGFRADSMCLDPSCPFYKKLSCMACFHANHPAHVRPHERVPLEDRRARSVTRQQNRSTSYCPEYASGPFALLCTLFEATGNERSARRELSLSESRLKKLAQGRCRANLYDRQARGRNAFACVESLSEKNLIRKELIPGVTEAEDKYSLLPDGERMARCCLAFERTLEEVLPNDRMTAEQRAVVGAGHNDKKVSLVVDNREDDTFVDRLIERCEDKGVPRDKRELPAGDYLFTIKDGNNVERVLPLVIERKSWSDLADSVNGGGKGHRRLDCVRVGGGNGGRCEGRRRCQLCRMKGSGCSIVMFIIEGSRCLNRDHEDKCNATKRCKYCKELEERHGPNLLQKDLERVLYQLNAEHNCLIHFTRGYNETIDSLLIMGQILGQSLDDAASTTADDPDIVRAIAMSLAETENSVADSPLSEKSWQTYEQFCSNARRSSSADEATTDSSFRRGNVVVWKAEEFIQKIHRGKIRESVSNGFSLGPVSSNVASRSTRNLNEDFDDEEGNGSRTAPQPNVVAGSVADPECVDIVDNDVVEIDSEEEEEFENSQESIYVLEKESGWTSAKRKIQETSNSKKESESPCIEIDSDDDDLEEFRNSQESVMIVEPPPGRKRKPEDPGDDVVVIDVAPRRSDLAATGQILARRTNHRATVAETGEYTSASSTPMLLIGGLYEYDTDYYHDINKVWQMAYQNHSNASASIATTGTTQQQDFSALAREQLRVVMDNELPLVQRKTVLFWILYIQLRGQAVLHPTRESSDIQRLRDKWQGLNAGDIQPGLGTNQSQDLPHQQNDADISEPPSCIICFAPLRAYEAEATPCGHTFHRHCLHTWFERSRTRSCPTCKYDGLGAPKDDRSASSRRSSTPQRRLPRAAPTSTGAEAAPTTEARRLREARLRRFENGDAVGLAGSNSTGATNRASSVAARPTQWTCTSCTLKNDIGSTSCNTCFAPSPFLKGNPGASLAGTLLVPHPQEPWTCDCCTLKNSWEARSCDACGTRNPFQVEDDIAPSIRTFAENLASSARDGGLPPRPPRNTASYPTAVTSSTLARKESPSTKSKVKCGACGLEGHNRGTATSANCTSFYKPEEVELRRKKREKATQKAQQEREEAERLRQRVEQDEVTQQARMAQLQRLLSEQQRDNEDSRTIARGEVRRREKAAERAAKRARRLG